MNNGQEPVYVCSDCGGVIPEGKLPSEEDWCCVYCGRSSELRLVCILKPAAVWAEFVGTDNRNYKIHPDDLAIAKRRGLVKRVIEDDVKLTPVVVTDEDRTWLKQIGVKP